MVGKLTLLILALLTTVMAEVPDCSDDTLRLAFEELHELDQGSRRGDAPANDLWNQDRLEELVSACGWPDARRLGRKAGLGAFLALQHSPLEMQLEYLPMLRKAAAGGMLVEGTLPLLEDRVRVRQGQPQIFGTQFTADCMPLEIEDALEVDARREEVGLMPLEEYLRECRARWPD